MNAAVYMDSCPPEETLAAFLDGRLDAKSRLQVVQHLAECGDCRDLVVAANEYESVNVTETDDNVVHVAAGRFGGSKFVPLLAAAAAVIVVLFGVPSIRERLLPGSGLNELVEAANALPKRATAARLSAGFAYRPHSVPRGGREESPDLRSPEDANADVHVLLAAHKIQDRARKNESAKNLHAVGIANIFMNARSEAVTALARAATADPDNADVLTDLSAAYIARADEGDYQRALSVATKAWELRRTPAAAWNRALALEYLQRTEDARVAWNDYLDLDPNSEWAKEVREKHLPNLQEH